MSTAAFSNLMTANHSIGVHEGLTTTETYTVNTLSASDVDGELMLIKATTEALLILIGVTGTVINGFVIFVILASAELRKNATNLFIGNQTAIDAVACIALTVTVTIQTAGISKYDVGLKRRILCWFFDNDGFLGAALCASKFSLTIITLERYFKVVRPVQHRNNLRPWLIKLGIAVPWINSLFIVLPLALTSDVVDGACYIPLQRPENGKSFSIFVFGSYFVLPLLVFIFSYSRILSVVRRQNRILAQTSLQPSSSVAGPSGSSRKLPGADADVPVTDQFFEDGGQPYARVSEDPSGQQMSRAERKIMRTLLTITACYIICWSGFELSKNNWGG
jgi:hypothetical protein